MNEMWSIVIPAYNESGRLPRYLDAIRHHAASGPPCEILVVDDGSTDDTLELLVALSRQWHELKVISHRQNRGKGAAIRTGIFAARGDVILVADADGAAPIEGEQLLRQALDRGASIACGSRRGKRRDSEHQRHHIRRVAGWVFSVVTALLVRTDVKDTQCGFKMFRRGAAKHLASLTSEDGYAIDVEVLALANMLGYPTTEVAISWHDVPGGNVRLLYDGAAMLLALARIRRRLKTLDRNDQVSLRKLNNKPSPIRCSSDKAARMRD